MEIQAFDIISSGRRSMGESKMADSPVMGGESKYSGSLESRSDDEPWMDRSDDHHRNVSGFSVKSITVVPEGTPLPVEVPVVVGNEKQRSSPRRISKTVRNNNDSTILSKRDLLSKNNRNLSLSSKSVRLLKSLVVEGTSPAPKKSRSSSRTLLTKESGGSSLSSNRSSSRRSSRSLLSSQQTLPKSPKILPYNTDGTKKTVPTSSNNSNTNDTFDDTQQMAVVPKSTRGLSKKDSMPSMSMLKSFFSMRSLDPSALGDDDNDEGAEVDYNDMSHEELVDAIETFRAVLRKERKKRTKNMVKLAKHLHKAQMERKELTEAHAKAMGEMKSVESTDDESIISEVESESEAVEWKAEGLLEEEVEDEEIKW
eukprot:CAMPEP_0198299702 /NCGR_PEP_ID=MMETSP1449-20131203/45606_1 /TAXON_ID=420275 /ORGANISM="Attheya septentrionalis, Strain CCMP2084" /LENGTH=368 /DNA_ID=CAMNT_0044001331 /DNA_START=38 /DNA_END=1141 /DNA_ORIENTATION=-